MPSDKRKAGDSVQVALRVRPLIGIETVQSCKPIIKYPRANQLVIGGDRAFTFDYVYPETTAQADLYDVTVAPLVRNFTSGYNATILAYGQTGSGKTFTMGTSSTKDVPDESLGIVPRVVRQIFETVKAAPEDINYTVKVSFLEIHKETMIDLMDTLGRDSDKEPSIRETPQGEIIVSNVEEVEVKNEAEMLDCLERGSLQRATGSTLMNATSSRSHAIFTVSLEQTRFETNPETAVAEEVDQLKSKFHFVDLAGSERLKRTGASGVRMKEGISINSGLLALGNVISALGDEKRKGGHVPFRDSKITRLLQDSLGGNSKTIMIACVSPADVNFEETLNTLKYANRARNIQNKAIINRDSNAAKFAAMKKRIQELEAALVSGGGIPGSASIMSPAAVSHMFEPSMEEVNFLKEQNETYEGEINRLMDSLKQSRAQVGQMSSTLLSVEQQRDTFRLKLKRVHEELSTAVDSDGPAKEQAQSLLQILDGELNAEELDALKDNHETIHELNKAITSLQADLRTQRETNKQLRKMVSMSGGARSTGSLMRAQDDSIAMDAQSEERKRALRAMHTRRESYEALVLPGVGDLMVPEAGLDSDIEEETIVEVDEDIDEELLQQEQVQESEQEMNAYKTLAGVRDREHTFNMQKLSQEHDQLAGDIMQKEALMKQLMKTRETANAMRRHYEQKIHEMEAEVQSVTTERAKALAELQKVGSDEAGTQHKHTIVSYEKRLKELNSELAKMRDQLKENSRLQQAHMRDEARITKLQSEIGFQRKEKVKLSRKMKEESERHRDWMKKTNNRLKVMERSMRKQKLEAQELQSQFSKQEAVLKRRVEEKAALVEQLKASKSEVMLNRAMMRNQVRSLAAKHHNPNVMLSGSRARARSRSAFLQREAAGAQMADMLQGTAAGVQTVASDRAPSVKSLQQGFDEEVERAVTKLNLIAEHQRLVESRAKVQAEHRKANAVLSRKASSLSAEQLQLWKDKAEGLKSELRYLSSRLVEVKLEISDLQKDGSIKKSLFSRHKVMRLDHGRALILHLMDQLVRTKRENEEVKQKEADLSVKLETARTELKTVTRQSLLLQKSPSANRMLRQMDADENTNASPVRQFLTALNVKPSPSVTRDNYMSPPDVNDSSPSAAPDSPSEDGSQQGDARPSGHHHRSRSDVPGGMSADDHVRKRTQSSSSTGADRAASGRRGNSVFDRLTDKSSYTGVYKSIHQEVPEKKRKPKSSDDFQKAFTAAARTDGAVKPEPVPAQPERPKPKRGGGDVFSRLTNTSNFTGVHKKQHEELQRDGVTEKPRSLSALENDFDKISEQWATSKPARQGRGKVKNRLSDTAPLPITRDDLARGIAMADEQTSAPVSVTITPSKPTAGSALSAAGNTLSPIDKQTAQTAVRKLDTLFDRFKKSKAKLAQHKAKLEEAQGPDENLVPNPSASSDAGDSGDNEAAGFGLAAPPPKAEDVLEALAILGPKG